MTSDDESKGPELAPGRSRLPGPGYNVFLGPPPPAPPPGPGRADVDDTIRLLRTLCALLVSSATLPLVAFAGIGMGVPPWLCLIAAFGGGPLTTWAFVMTFEKVRRSSPPDGPEDRPSSGGP